MAPRCRERAPSTTSIATDAPQQTASLFDQLVGADLQRQRHSEKEKYHLAVAALDCFILIRRPN
jgi:hypothetical protein